MIRVQPLTLRVATHHLHNFLLMVAMHDNYYCILTGASLLQHKEPCSTFLERGKLELHNMAVMKPGK